MKNRNLAIEILEKKRRLDSSKDPVDHIYGRLYDISLLENFYEEVLTNNFFDRSEISSALEIYNSAFFEGIKYIPVSLVACIESFFRLVFARTIDADPFYKINAAKFDIKFSLQAAIDLDAHNLSIGEFISHLLKASNINDIDSNMSQILGENYLTNFKKWRKKLDMQEELFPIADSDKDADILGKLDRLFKLRHCICHEAFTQITREDYRDLVSFTPSVMKLLTVTEKYVEEHISLTKSRKFDDSN
tara:strand:- start:878 stop:1618 length:741 start_codon:yes stop_codon:yes gene_type:complete